MTVWDVLRRHELNAELMKARTRKYKKRERRGGKWIYWYRTPSGKLVSGEKPTTKPHGTETGWNEFKLYTTDPEKAKRVTKDIRSAIDAGDVAKVKRLRKLYSDLGADDTESRELIDKAIETVGKKLNQAQENAIDKLREREHSKEYKVDRVEARFAVVEFPESGNRYRVESDGTFKQTVAGEKKEDVKLDSISKNFEKLGYKLKYEQWEKNDNVYVGWVAKKNDRSVNVTKPELVMGLDEFAEEFPNEEVDQSWGIDSETAQDEFNDNSKEILLQLRSELDKLAAGEKKEGVKRYGLSNAKRDIEKIGEKVDKKLDRMSEELMGSEALGEEREIYKDAGYAIQEVAKKLEAAKDKTPSAKKLIDIANNTDVEYIFEKVRDVIEG